MNCLRCLRAGHNCEATHKDEGEDVCVFCLDGERCPKMPKVPKGTNGYQKPTAPPAKMRPHERTSAMPKIIKSASFCKAPECTKRLRFDNKTGFCMAHHHLSRRIERRNVASTRPAFDEPEVELTLSESQLDRMLAKLLPLAAKKKIAAEYLNGEMTA